MLRISIDLMGGDNAPNAILKSISNFKNIHFIISGSKTALSLIKNYKIQNFEIIITNTILEEGVKASKTEIENSSIYSAVMQVANKNADCVISAGTTGYYLLICKKLLGTINEISRPALATYIPTIKGNCILIDLGANLSCSESDLVNFAIMGKSLAKALLNKNKIKIGILNVGKEEKKGPEILRKTMATLKSTMNDEVIVSFAEGNHMFTGEFDIIVTDGFTGNCILKAVEGSSDFLNHLLETELKKTFINRILSRIFKKQLDNIMPAPFKHNGAMFAGINGCAIKAHGHSNSESFSNALSFAISISNQRRNIISQIKKDLEQQ